MILTIRIRLLDEEHRATRIILEWIAKAYSHTTFSVLSWTVKREEGSAE